MKRLGLTLLATLLAAGASWAQTLPLTKIAELKDLAEEATAAASTFSYTAPDPVLKGQVDAQPKCTQSNTEVKDAVINQYRAKFRGVKGGEDVVKREPSWNNARLCYYLVAATYFQLK